MYNIRDSPVVTHPSTSLTIIHSKSCLLGLGGPELVLLGLKNGSRGSQKVASYAAIPFWCFHDT